MEINLAIWRRLSLSYPDQRTKYIEVKHQWGQKKPKARERRTYGISGNSRAALHQPFKGSLQPLVLRRQLLPLNSLCR